MKEKYYFAYGSNLNMLQMAKRCPLAKPVGAYKLKIWLLVFGGVADIEPTVSKGIGAAMAAPLIGKAVIPTIAATALLGLTARPAGSYYENEMDE